MYLSTAALRNWKYFQSFFRLQNSSFCSSIKTNDQDFSWFVCLHFASRHGQQVDWLTLWRIAFWLANALTDRHLIGRRSGTWLKFSTKPFISLQEFRCGGTILNKKFGKIYKIINFLIKIFFSRFLKCLRQCTVFTTWSIQTILVMM